MDETKVRQLLADYATERAELLEPLNDPDRRPYLKPITKDQMERRVCWCAGAIEALGRVLTL